ncbi:hypothetical protein BP5796_12754 [Coleophoma crateriformis]|uniref:Uncharacterized protein n=1 Tax=Coleophoma crateriformis TaxID=565419 RepID=A0A3D8Q7B0_9HELO|nr:hypothetical protein BP5796_12754 [Coleophoma crateriformis]
MGNPASKENLDIQDLLNTLFEEVLNVFAEIDYFSKESSPTIFLVYAHENPSVGNANAEWAVRLIGWLGKVRSRTFSDKSLVPGLWATREDNFASVHDVLSNQFCLLPARSTVAKGKRVTRVDKVIVCCSEVLQSYFTDPRMNGYIKALKEFYSDMEKEYQDADTIENGIQKLVQKYRNEDGFHHVVTELVFLEIRSSQKARRHDIIPVVFNGNDIKYLSYFDETETVWMKVRDVPSMLHPCQALHKLFFKVLRRLYEDKERTINELEDLYWKCTQSLLSQESLPGYEAFMETISVEKRKTLGNLERSLYASIRVGPSSASQPSPIFFVPFERNPNFVGRESIILELDKKLSSSNVCQRVTLWGLGGTGKTQIALEYAFRRRDATPKCAVFWIPAITTATFEKAYLDIGKLLKIPGISEPMADVKNLVREKLNDEKTGQWLIIVDNADDTDVLFKETGIDTLPLIDYLPSSSKGSMIFTTRTRVAAVEQVNTQENRIEVPEMGKKEAKDLLKATLGETAINQEPGAVDELIRILAHLPLAIIQAASFISKNAIQLENYISMFNSSETNTINILSRNFEDRNRYREMKNPIATTWLISFEQIRKENPLAIAYLSFIACVSRENIPHSLLPEGATELDRFEAVGTLTAYSFLTKKEKPNTFDMHRLVHLVTRNWLKDQGQLPSQTEITLSRLSEALPYGGHKNYKIWEQYLPHATYVVTLANEIVDWEARATLLDKIGRCQESIGQYKVAEGIYRDVLELRRSKLGENNPSTLISMSDIGGALSGQGKYADAENIHRETLALQEKVLGKEHPDTLTSMNELGGALSGQGKYADAEHIHRETLALREKVLGKEHPGTLTSMSNVAGTLSNQGKYADAGKMHQASLALREKVSGKEHPYTLTSMSNVATALINQGMYADAEKMHRETLALREKVLGKEHPNTLKSMSNVATALSDQGMYADAEKMHQETLALQEKVLGKEHPDTLTSMSNVAATLSNKGKYADAEKMHQATLALRETLLGKEHPDTLTSMMWVATILENQGNYIESEKMYTQILKTREKVLGKEHPHTQNSRGHLKNALRKEGRHAEAEAIVGGC